MLSQNTFAKAERDSRLQKQSPRCALQKSFSGKFHRKATCENVVTTFTIRKKTTNSMLSQNTFALIHKTFNILKSI